MTIKLLGTYRGENQVHLKKNKEYIMSITEWSNGKMDLRIDKAKVSMFLESWEEFFKYWENVRSAS